MHTAPITPASLTAFDWFLVVVVLLSTFAAFRRGIIKVLFSIIGLIAGLLIASWNYTHFAHTLHRWITSYTVAQVAAFIIILLAVTIAFSLAAGLVRKTASAVGLGMVDRLLGAVFGLLRGLLIGVAVMMLYTAFLPASPWLKGSRLAPGFLAGAHTMAFLVPTPLRDRIALGAAYLLQQTPDVFRPHTLTHPM